MEDLDVGTAPAVCSKSDEHVSGTAPAVHTDRVVPALAAESEPSDSAPAVDAHAACKIPPTYITATAIDEAILCGHTVTKGDGELQSSLLTSRVELSRNPTFVILDSGCALSM